LGPTTGDAHALPNEPWEHAHKVVLKLSSYVLLGLCVTEPTESFSYSAGNAVFCAG